MEIARGRNPERSAEKRGPTFTGDVWLDPVLTTGDGAAVNSVFFTPAARTHWHSHERGQLLYVTSGAGLVGSEGAEPQEIRAGDSVWTPASELHWHGAAPSSCMGHLAVSLGVTTWGGPVTDDEYGASTPPA